MTDSKILSRSTEKPQQGRGSRVPPAPRSKHSRVEVQVHRCTISPAPAGPPAPSKGKQEEPWTSLRLHGKCRLDKTRGRLCSPAAAPCRGCALSLTRSLVSSHMFRRRCRLSGKTAGKIRKMEKRKNEIWPLFIYFRSNFVTWRGGARQTVSIQISRRNVDLTATNNTNNLNKKQIRLKVLRVNASVGKIPIREEISLGKRGLVYAMFTPIVWIPSQISSTHFTLLAM